MKKSEQKITQPGPGRPIGSCSPQTARKRALRVLGSIVMDDTSSDIARAIAACKLIDEVAP